MGVKTIFARAGPFFHWSGFLALMYAGDCLISLQRHRTGAAVLLLFRAAPRCVVCRHYDTESGIECQPAFFKTPFSCTKVLANAAGVTPSAKRYLAAALLIHR